MLDHDSLTCYQYVEQFLRYKFLEQLFVYTKWHNDWALVQRNLNDLEKVLRLFEIGVDAILTIWFCNHVKEFRFNYEYLSA